MSAATDKPVFTQEQMEQIASAAAKAAADSLLQQMNLDSHIENASSDTPGKEISRIKCRKW